MRGGGAMMAASSPRGEIVALVGACAVLAGCASVGEVRTVQVPVAVSCLTALPARPAMPFDAVPAGADVYTAGRALLADRRVRQGYEAELEAALRGCVGSAVVDRAGVDPGGGAARE